MNDNTFNAVVMSKSDFKDSFPELSKKELDKVWTYAVRKMPDYFFQDYDLIMNAVKDDALRNYS